MSLQVTRAAWLKQYRLFDTPDLRKFRHSERRVIKENAQYLLERLYEPRASDGRKAAHEDIKKYGLDEDAINWGDLGVLDVYKVKGIWRIAIEEVAPDAENLQAYIILWLKRWGWTVQVETSW